jgi:ribosomal-protein-alanine N-acetyltransferase
MVSIEPVSMNHAERLQTLVSHPEILASTMLPDPYPDDGVVRWIQGLGKKSRGGTEYGFAVINDVKEIVGTCGFIHPPEDIGVAEIGYWIGRAYWNRGYATQALRLLLDRVFKDDTISIVRARTLKSNRASCAVLEKLGFVVRREVPNEHPKWSRQEAMRQYEVGWEDWVHPSVAYGAAQGAGEHGPRGARS